MKDQHDLSGEATPPRNSASTSESLLERLKAGDGSGWRRFVKLYTPLVVYWCVQAGVRGAAAEDVTQEVFLTVYTKMVQNGEFDKRLRHGSFRAWLGAITRFKLLAHFRDGSQEPRPVGGSGGQALLDQVPDDPPGSDDAAAEATDHAILRRRALALVRAECDARTYEAAYRVIDGQRPADVAAALGMTVNAVYIAKSRFLARSRAIIREFEAEARTEGPS